VTPTKQKRRKQPWWITLCPLDSALASYQGIWSKSCTEMIKQSSTHWNLQTSECILICGKRSFCCLSIHQIKQLYRTSLLCHLVLLGGNVANFCIDKKSLFRTVMPLSKYCCIKISSPSLCWNGFTHLGNIMHLRKNAKYSSLPKCHKCMQKYAVTLSKQLNQWP
jgi:hypothetical protein